MGWCHGEKTKTRETNYGPRAGALRRQIPIWPGLEPTKARRMANSVFWGYLRTRQGPNQHAGSDPQWRLGSWKKTGLHAGLNGLFKKTENFSWTIFTSLFYTLDVLTIFVNVNSKRLTWKTFHLQLSLRIRSMIEETVEVVHIGSCRSLGRCWNAVRKNHLHSQSRPLFIPAAAFDPFPCIRV